jgi:hypothetical protein
MIEVGYQVPETEKKKKKDSRKALGLSGKFPLGMG